MGLCLLFYSCDKEDFAIQEENSKIDNIESRSNDGTGENIIEILASGTSIGKSNNVRVQLSDGSFTNDWSNQESGLAKPITFSYEEPIFHPVLPSGTCCEIQLLPPYIYNNSELFLFIGERGIDSPDGYLSQFVDFDVDKIEPEQTIHFFDGRRNSAAAANNYSCDVPDSGFGLWWPTNTIEPGRYNVHVSKGWVLTQGNEGICDTDEKTYRVNN